MVGVVCYHFSKKTPLIRASNLSRFECECCGLLFDKPAAWAKRCNHHYCSRACHNEARRIKIKKTCIICNKVFFTTPHGWFRHVTCSKECRSIKCIPLPELYGWIEMNKMKEHIYSIHNCEICNVEYRREPSWVRRSGTRFCSKKCHGISKREVIRHD